MIERITQGLGNSRMMRAEAAQQPQPSGPIQPQNSAPSSPAPMASSGTPSMNGGASGGQGGTSFVDYVATALHDSSTFEQHVQMIGQGPQGAAQVAVSIGESAVKEHQARGIEPSVEEQTAALEMVLDDVTDIGVSQGSLPKDKEQAEYQVAQAALPMWAQAMGMDPKQLAQEIAADATPEDQAMAQKFHQGSQNAV